VALADPRMDREAVGILTEEPPDAVELLRRTYATAAPIATALKVDRRVLERDSRAAQIRPAAISANVGVELYMIEELRPRYPMPV
jgi:hypothetical protein